MKLKLISSRIFILLIFLASPSLLLAAEKVKIIFTTDVHGAIFPYDFIKQRKASGSLSQVYGYVQEQRKESSNVLLFDDGDMLQGQPTVYYYNFVDTITPHIQAQVMNFMGYNALTVGNHDLEPGHPVYDRVREQSNFPWLAANAVTPSGKPYFEPYKVFTVDGKKIAVLGLITPAIPSWLPEAMWQGMVFEDMIESAKKWVDIIQKKEKPDAIVGLFHSGANYTYNNQDADTYKNENAGVLVAQKVKGFDAVLLGHDHQVLNKKIANSFGDSVLLLNPSAGARNVAEMVIDFDKGKKDVYGKIVSMESQPSDPNFDAKFSDQLDQVKAFTSKKIGTLPESISSKDAFFGSSSFVDLVHRLMLKDSKADISLASPLLMNAEIPAGDITVGDMFNLYKYENLYYVLNMTGQEVKDLLEYSYSLWIKTVENGDNGILLLNDKNRLKNQYYNFDSGAGITYTVDVTKPEGQRVNILSMSNGTPFNLSKTYKVAMTSYRGNGGGGHLTVGAKIPAAELGKRVIYTSDYDLRYLIMKDIERNGTLDARPLNSWKFIPEELVIKAKAADEQKVFKR